MCIIGTCSKNWKSYHRNFRNKEPSLAHTGVGMNLSVYHSAHRPRSKIFIRKRNTLQKRFVHAEGTRKTYLIKSVRTHFLSGSQVYFAKWCRVPTALNNFQFHLILNSMNKCEHRIHIHATLPSHTYYQINGLF